jgi:hypothetical protein
MLIVLFWYIGAVSISGLVVAILADRPDSSGRDL